MRRPMAVWLLLLGLFMLELPLCSSQVVDAEYQDWAAKVADMIDDRKKAEDMGKQVACSFCQIVLRAVVSQSAANKQRRHEDRFKEEELKDLLGDLCDRMGPRVAKAMDGYAKDGIMVCKRVVREHSEEMIDAVSLGEDVDLYCKDAKLCPAGLDKMMDMVHRLSEHMAEKQKAKEGDKEGDSGTDGGSGEQSGMESADQPGEDEAEEEAEL